MAKFAGVVITDKEVDIAVSPTDNSVLALEMDDMKFEILPPGQAATSIIPMATMGGMNL